MVESGTCYHLTGDTPSVRPFGLPAPPPGSRVQPPLKGEDGASRRRGQARYAEYHLKCTKANSYNPLLPPLGEVPRSGKGGGVGDFESLPFNERHPLSQPLRAASSPIGEPRGTLRIRPRFHKTAGTYRTPQPLRRQLSSALSGCTPSGTATPAKPFRGAWGRHRPLRSRAGPLNNIP